MRYALGKNGVDYSPAERALFELLPVKPKRISSTELVTQRYGSEVPFHAQSIIRSTMDSLIRKIEANREPFRVLKTPRAGPKPTEFWLEKRA